MIIRSRRKLILLALAVIVPAGVIAALKVAEMTLEPPQTITAESVNWETLRPPNDPEAVFMLDGTVQNATQAMESQFFQ